MWRGFLVSFRYSLSCWSVSLRPNHVFHQNRKGIRQISHAVRKKRSFWVRDMPGLGSCTSWGGWTGIGSADMLGTKDYSLHDVSVKHSILFEIMRNRVLGQKWRLEADFGPDPFALGVRSIGCII